MGAGIALAGNVTQRPDALSAAASSYIFGDSIGQGVGTAGNIPGTTQVGKGPQWVLDQINANPDNIKGKNIYLSTGIINDQSQFPLIDKQLEALHDAGAKNVTVLGVANHNTELNSQLADAVHARGYTFAGGFDAGNDGIHPRDYGGYWKTVSTGYAVPAQDDIPTVNVTAKRPAPDTSAADAAPPASNLPSDMWTLPRFQRGILAAEGSAPTAVSPSGARSSWQVLPSTATDPGYGITPAKDPYDLNELNRIGSEYSGAMFKKYGPTLGAAAYNWGPGNVDKLVAQYGDPRKGDISMADFVSKLPSSVRGYVSKVAGGQLALPAQVTVAQSTAQPDQPPAARDVQNQLAMPAQQQPVDMRRQMLLASLQALLPRGYGYHPIDEDPFKRAYETYKIHPDRPYIRDIEPARPLATERAQAAYSPAMAARLGQKGPRE